MPKTSPTNPLAEPGIASIYPDFTGHTFDDAVKLARQHLRRSAGAIAATAALARGSCIDRDAIATDTGALADMGLLALLRHRQATLTNIVQRGISRLVPLPTPASLTSTPPYPTQDGLDAADTFASGADVILPHPLPPQRNLPTRTPAEHLAIEYLVEKERKKGLCVVLPLSHVEAACASEGLPLRRSPCFIQRKADPDPDKAAAGRKCDDYTFSGLNTNEKALVLAARHGAYNDPNVATFARLFLLAKARFPGEAIYMMVSDFDAFYKKFIVRPEHITLLATQLDIEGIPHVVLPLVGPFGLQDSNAWAKTATEAIHAIATAHHVRLYGVGLQATYVDDTGAFASLPAITDIKCTHTAVSDSVLGPASISQAKTKIAQINDMIGFRFDCIAGTVGVTMTWFLKLIAVFFLELPADPAPGRKIRFRQVQRTAAYMLRTSEVIFCMRAFSRGLYRIPAPVVDTASATVRLSRDAVIDILAWRALLHRVWINPSLLVVPMWAVPLTCREHPDEPLVDMWRRQAAAARTIINVDACTKLTTTTHDQWGAGFVAFDNTGSSPSHRPAIAFGTYAIDRVAATIAGLPIDNVDVINIYEFLAALIAITTVAADHRPTDIAPGALWHIHVWTDNTVCQRWLTTHKSSHPLVTHLLRLLVDLQIQHNVLVTLGHVPGRVNTMADDASRGFRTATGPSSFTALSHLVPHRSLPTWWPDINRL